MRRQEPQALADEGEEDGARAPGCCCLRQRAEAHEEGDGVGVEVARAGECTGAAGASKEGEASSIDGHGGSPRFLILTKRSRGGLQSMAGTVGVGQRRHPRA